MQSTQRSTHFREWPDQLHSQPHPADLHQLYNENVSSVGEECVFIVDVNLTLITSDKVRVIVASSLLKQIPDLYSQFDLKKGIFEVGAPFRSKTISTIFNFLKKISDQQEDISEFVESELSSSEIDLYDIYEMFSFIDYYKLEDLFIYLKNYTFSCKSLEKISVVDVFNLKDRGYMQFAADLTIFLQLISPRLPHVYILKGILNNYIQFLGCTPLKRILEVLQIEDTRLFLIICVLLDENDTYAHSKERVDVALLLLNKFKPLTSKYDKEMQFFFPIVCSVYLIAKRVVTVNQLHCLLDQVFHKIINPEESDLIDFRGPQKTTMVDIEFVMRVFCFGLLNLPDQEADISALSEGVVTNLINCKALLLPRETILETCQSRMLFHFQTTLNPVKKILFSELFYKFKFLNNSMDPNWDTIEIFPHQVPILYQKIIYFVDCFPFAIPHYAGLAFRLMQILSIHSDGGKILYNIFGDHWKNIRLTIPSTQVQVPSLNQPETSAPAVTDIDGRAEIISLLMCKKKSKAERKIQPLLKNSSSRKFIFDEIINMIGITGAFRFAKTFHVVPQKHSFYEHIFSLLLKIDNRNQALILAKELKSDTFYGKESDAFYVDLYAKIATNAILGDNTEEAIQIIENNILNIFSEEKNKILSETTHLYPCLLLLFRKNGDHLVRLNRISQDLQLINSKKFFPIALAILIKLKHHIPQSCILDKLNHVKVIILLQKTLVLIEYQLPDRYFQEFLNYCTKYAYPALQNLSQKENRNRALQSDTKKIARLKKLRKKTLNFYTFIFNFAVQQRDWEDADWFENKYLFANASTSPMVLLSKYHLNQVVRPAEPESNTSAISCFLTCLKASSEKVCFTALQALYELVQPDCQSLFDLIVAQLQKTPSQYSWFIAAYLKIVKNKSQQDFIALATTLPCSFTDAIQLAPNLIDSNFVDLKRDGENEQVLQWEERKRPRVLV